jgi:hypothetical protein
MYCSSKFPTISSAKEANQGSILNTTARKNTALLYPMLSAPLAFETATFGIACVSRLEILVIQTRIKRNYT